MKKIFARYLGEQKLIEMIKNEFDKTATVNIVDTSHGCGQMYDIHIKSKKFKDLSELERHRTIHNILKDESKSWHGYQFKLQDE